VLVAAQGATDHALRGRDDHLGDLAPDLAQGGR
jgi:hypothetical protein